MVPGMASFLISELAHARINTELILSVSTRTANHDTTDRDVIVTTADSIQWVIVRRVDAVLAEQIADTLTTEIVDATGRPALIRVEELFDENTLNQRGEGDCQKREAALALAAGVATIAAHTTAAARRAAGLVRNRVLRRGTLRRPPLDLIPE